MAVWRLLHRYLAELETPPTTLRLMAVASSVTNPVFTTTVASASLDEEDTGGRYWHSVGFGRSLYDAENTRYAEQDQVGLRSVANLLVLSGNKDYEW